MAHSQRSDGTWNRGRKRRRSSRRRKPAATVRAGTRIGTESQASANYRNGAAVKYRWRIAGPTFNTSTYPASELPEASRLTP